MIISPSISLAIRVLVSRLARQFSVVLVSPNKLTNSIDAEFISLPMVLFFMQLHIIVRLFSWILYLIFYYFFYVFVCLPSDPLSPSDPTT